jgi:hypothetical protein
MKLTHLSEMSDGNAIELDTLSSLKQRLAQIKKEVTERGKPNGLDEA